MRIEIDRDQCMGSGTCEFWAPSVFRVTEKIQGAVGGCPTGAIWVCDEP